jgi:deoxyribodipyrimidine photo-lyase
MTGMTRVAIVWFRRDLRVHDHPALTRAVESADVVIPLFVFDDVLLGGRFASANRAWFMRESVVELSRSLDRLGASLRVGRGRPADVVLDLVRETGASEVHVTRDAAPYGARRDRDLSAALATRGVSLHESPGLYVHGPDEVLAQGGRPFTVFGPYRRAWEARPVRAVLPPPDRIPGAGTGPPDPVPLVGDPSADPARMPEPGEAAARERLERWLHGPLEAYAATRNRLGMDGTSRLSQDLRWGLLSPLEIVARAMGEGDGDGRRAFAAELAWRDFYAQILWHRPLALTQSFQPAGRRVAWIDDPAAFAAWAEGRTGYPVVDAAMRQLRATGFVHNRARMIAASFLTKDLLADWRLGEAEFMRHLLDGDVASNNGGWQWSASTGTDPQPWFRIFNPVLQGQRFDPDGSYVRRWVPELSEVPANRIHEPWTMTRDEQAAAGVRLGRDYPAPIVDHAEARTRALGAFSAARDAARDAAERDAGTDAAMPAATDSTS